VYTATVRPVFCRAGDNRNQNPRAVGVLTRSIDVSQRQADRREAIHFGVGAQVYLAGEFADRMRRQRIDVVTLVYWHARLSAIAQSAGTGVDDPPYCGLPGCFAEIDGAQHIAARVELGIGHRCVEVSLRCEVEDDVRVGARDDVNQLRSLNVDLYQRKPALMLVVAAERMLEIGGNPVRKLSIPTT
jgi:hypothetical protein